MSLRSVGASTIAVVLGGVVLAGCLGPREDPSRFFLLTAAPGSGGAAPASEGIIGVGPLEMPSYLNGPTLVTRVTDNEIVVSSHERWAEPLRDNIVEVLVDNLAERLGAPVVAFPALLSDPVRLRVPIVLRRFERDSTGAVELWARWALDETATGETLRTGESRISRPSGGAGGEASVATMSAALGELSGEIAEAIRALPRR